MSGKRRFAAFALASCSFFLAISSSSLPRRALRSASVLRTLGSLLAVRTPAREGDACRNKGDGVRGACAFGVSPNVRGSSWPGNLCRHCGPSSDPKGWASTRVGDVTERSTRAGESERARRCISGSATHTRAAGRGRSRRRTRRGPTAWAFGSQTQPRHARIEIKGSRLPPASWPEEDGSSPWARVRVRALLVRSRPTSRPPPGCGLGPGGRPGPAARAQLG